MNNRLVIHAPAKINLYLRVYPRTADGFHPLRSWFRTVELFDELQFDLVPDVRDGLRLLIECEDPDVPAGDRSAENLAFDAWYGTSFLLGETKTSARLRLSKTIPLGGGLGGGSSDAAATIKARLHFAADSEKSAPRYKVDYIALQTGSDVPFFLSCQLDGISDAEVTGRGDVVTPFRPGRRHTALLLFPGVQMSTPQVFRAFDARTTPPDDGEPDFAKWSALPAIELLPHLRNDLEPAASVIEPSLGKLRSDCEKKLGRPVRMSGSGSTLFTLYDSDDEAKFASKQLDMVRSRVA